MSASDIEAEVIVKMDSKMFEKGSEKIGKSLDKISGKAKQSGDKVDGSFDKMGQSADAAGNDIQQFGDKADRAMDKTVDATDQGEQAMTTMAVSVLGLAQAMAGLTDQVFGLDSALVGLAKTAFGVKEAFRDAERAAEDLRIEIALGNISLFEQTRLLQDLAFLNRKAALEVKSLAAEEQAMNGQYVNFALNIATTVIFSITTIISLRTILKLKTIQNTAATVADTAADTVNSGSKAANTAATTANTGAATLNTAGTTLNSTAKGINSTAMGFNTGGTVLNTGALTTNTAVMGSNTVATGFLTGAKVALTGAVLAAGGAVKAFTLAMLTSPLAPFAIAAIAAGTAFIAYEGNLLGARDAIEDLTGAERGSLPTLTGGMLDLSFKTEEVNENFRNTEFTMEEIQQAATMMNMSLEDTIQLMTKFKNADGSFNFELALSVKRAAEAGEEIETLGTTLTGVTSKFGLTSSAIFRFNEQIAGKGVEDLENRITLLQTALNNTDFDPLSDGFKLAKASIMLEITDIARGLEIISQDRTDEFLASFEKMGILVPDDLAKIEKAIGRVNDALDETKKKLPQFESDSRSAVLRLLEQATAEESAGNRAGALFLQRAARSLGGETSGSLRSLEEQARGSSNLRTFIQGGRFTTTTLGGLTSFASSGEQGSAVEFGGSRSAGTPARGHSKFRRDRVGGLRNVLIRSLGRRTITVGGRTFRLTSLGNLLGVNYKDDFSRQFGRLPSTRFIDERGVRSFSRGKGQSIANLKIQERRFFAEFNRRFNDAKLLFDLAPEEFGGDFTRAASLQRGNIFRNPTNIVDTRIGAFFTEINEGSAILGGFDTSQEEERFEDTQVKAKALTKRIADLNRLRRGAQSGNIFRVRFRNRLAAALRQMIDEGTSQGELQRDLIRLNRILTRGIVDAEALLAFTGNRTEFRNQVGFNVRLDRFGTTESVIDTEDIIGSTGTGLDFLSQDEESKRRFEEQRAIQEREIVANKEKSGLERFGFVGAETKFFTDREMLFSHSN